MASLWPRTTWACWSSEELPGTEDEGKTQGMAAALLIVGNTNDLRSVRTFTTAVLLNEGAVAVDQDTRACSGGWVPDFRPRVNPHHRGVGLKPKRCDRRHVGVCNQKSSDPTPAQIAQCIGGGRRLALALAGRLGHRRIPGKHGC